MKEIRISKTNAGGRLDKMALRYLDKAPKSFVYKMLRKKNIVLNGKKANGNELLKEGDSIRFYLSDETIAVFQGEKRANTKAPALKSDMASMIVYEDDMILGMNKPAGLLSQRAKPEDVSLDDYLKAYLDLKGEESEIPFTPGISNRLDRNTTGLVLAGKNLYASRMLNEAIKDRRIQKLYLCPVKGEIRKGERIDGWLIKDEKTNTVRIIRSEEKETERKGAERICTAYRPLVIKNGFTLLEVDLITGKSHQIRAHLSSIGHPILGDQKYGDREVNSGLKEQYGLNRQLLHAERIVFHGMEGDLSYLNGKELKAPVPEDFKGVLSGLSLDTDGCF